MAQKTGGGSVVGKYLAQFNIRMGELEFEALDYASKLLKLNKAQVIRKALHSEYRKIMAYIDDPEEMEAWRKLVEMVEGEYSGRKQAWGEFSNANLAYARERRGRPKKDKRGRPRKKTSKKKGGENGA